MALGSVMKASSLGDFVYCSLALYRQWRVGHAGALRLLVNLIGG